MKISRDTWRIIEMKIRRYPDLKKEYNEYISVIMSASQGSSHINSDSSNAQSVTEAKALKMTSAYYDSAKRETQAIEFVYNSLNDEEKKIFRERFWTTRKKNIPYLKMQNVSYSERQCRRIVYKIIVMTGKALGELK